MSHARQQIREQLVSTLTGLTTTGARIFANRVHDHAALPSLNVMTNSESVEDEVGLKQFRSLNIVIEARAKASADMDDQIDDICAEVSAALFAAGSTLSGKCHDLTYEGVDIQLSGEGDQPIGLAAIRYIAVYRVNSADVTTLIS